MKLPVTALLLIVSGISKAGKESFFFTVPLFCYEVNYIYEIQP